MTILWILHKDLSSTLHPAAWDCFDSNTRNAVESVGKSTFLRLKNKLNNLVTRSRPHHKGPRNSDAVFSDFKFHNRVLNLSSRSFTPSQMSLLNQGLKYNPPLPPSNKDKDVLIAHIEKSLRYVQPSEQLPILQKVDSLVNNFKGDSIPRQTRAMVSELKPLCNSLEKDNLVICKADKGNCVVILDKSSYIEKTSSFLNSQDFELLSKNPLNSYSALLRKSLKTHTDFFKTYQVFPSSLISTNPSTPRLYSLPKIHKKEFPIRPVVSFMNSPAYKLSSFLSKILPDLLGFQPLYSVKNTHDLISKLNNTKIPDSDTILLSFDVTNLFPSVPVPECLQLIKTRLFDSSIPNNTAQSVFSLLETALKQNFFVFNDRHYKQKTGLGMGSPLSPFLSELFLDNLEQTIISKSPLFQEFTIGWFRYVDDILVLFRGTKDQANSLLQFLNEVHPNLKFTVEFSTNDELSFLDLNISIVNNSFSFGIFHKPTTTDSIIPYFSSHPYSHKLAFFHSSFHRLLFTPLNEENFNKELNFIRQIAINNNYPLNLINSIFNKKRQMFHLSQATGLISLPKDSTTRFVSIPYFSGLSQKISRLFKPFDIRVSFSVPHNLRSYLVKTKASIPLIQRSGVYKLTCTCGCAYIGRTYRSFDVRFKEHLRHIKNNQIPQDSSNAMSAFSSHCVTLSHTLGEDFASFLHLTDDKLICNFLEELEIRRFHSSQPLLCLNEQTHFNSSVLLPFMFP